VRGAAQARFDAGYKSSYMATIDAMSGITSAIVTSTLVFMAVFIPVAMMGGTSGVFYTQFGITMAVAVGLSAVNALTLSPALCAMILKPYLDENGEMRDNFAARFRKAFNTAFGALVNKYKHGVMLFIKHKWLMWSTLGLTIAALALLMNTTKTGLVPDEDQGTIMVNVTTAPGSSLAETHKVMEQVSQRINGIPQIRDYMQVAGYGMIAGQGSSYGMAIIKLKDWDERPNKEDDVNAVIGQIYGRTADITDEQMAWLEQDLKYVPKDKLIIIGLHIATSRRNRPTSHVADYKELYALLDGYNVRILSGHSHNNYTTTISETIEENTLGAVMGAYWNGEELCNDGSPRGYAVYEIEGNRIRNWYYKGTAFPREYQMYLYGPGEAVSEKYRDGLILNIFNWHTTWTVEVQEDNAGWVTLPSDSNLRYEMDRRAYDFMFGDTKPEHRPTAEPESNNDHMFYYKPASESWGTVTVRASDPYGNVYTESIRNE